MSVKIQKNIVCAKKTMFGILQHVAAAKMAGSIIIRIYYFDLVAMCHEIIDTTKFVPTKSNSAKAVLIKCTSTKTVLTKFTLTNFC